MGYIAVVRFILPVLFLFGFVTISPAQEVRKPESVVENMSTKLVRGVTNVGTSIVELPKQTYLSVRDDGGMGYVIGPLKGIGMTIVRALAGVAETAFFLVPQPGFYDPVMDPPYVWQGWEPKTVEHERSLPPDMSGVEE